MLQNRGGTARFGRRDVDGELCSGWLRANARKEKGWGGTDDGRRERIRTPPRGVRGSPTDDAWSRRRSVVVRAPSIVEAQCLILTVFDSCLTIRISKFDIGTWNLAKIKVVEQKKSYNFRFGRKLIWGSDQGEKHSRTRLKGKLLCELD